MEEVVESSGSGSQASRRAGVPVISVVLSHLGGIIPVLILLLILKTKIKSACLSGTAR